MSCTEKLESFLNQRKVSWDVVRHREAFTAQDIAQTMHVTGRQVAKVVVLREGTRNYFMVVLPAHEHLSFGVLRRMTGRRGLGLATELEMMRLFPDCEPGAMPPFGALYNLPTYVDACLGREPEIYFQAGNHHELVRMRWTDFARVAGPFAGQFCLHETHAVLTT